MFEQFITQENVKNQRISIYISQLPPHDDLSQLTNMFGEYFYRKIELIRNDIDNTILLIHNRLNIVDQKLS